MKRQLLLLVLPSLLVSCANKVVTEKVSFQRFCSEYQNETTLKKAKTVLCTFSEYEDTDNWKIIGYYSDAYKTGYEKENFRSTWTMQLNFDEDGNIDNDDVISAEDILVVPYQLTYDRLTALGALVTNPDGAVTFTINPLQAKSSGFVSETVTDSGTGMSVFLDTAVVKNEVFNDQQWVTNYTMSIHQYIYNQTTAVRAYREYVIDCEFKYNSYHY